MRRQDPADASLFSNYQLIPAIFQQLNFAEWPQFCDHSVTSADVRLSVGNTHRETVATIFDALGF